MFGNEICILRFGNLYGKLLIESKTPCWRGVNRMEKFQHTLKKKVRIAGVGLHSGRRVTLNVLPAPENSGIRFIRKNDAGQPVRISAFLANITDTRLATTIGAEKVSVSTVEHLLAAFAGLEIDNAVIEIDEAEVPILDGSAALFVDVLQKAQRVRQRSHRRMIRINKEINFVDGDKSVTVLPYDGFRVTCEIDFPHEIIKKQKYSVRISPKLFVEQIAPARTFGFLEEIETLRQNGLALGGSLENAVVVSRFGGVLNEEGLRFADEFVRHKALDLMGDLALLGCPVLGHVVARKAGHKQHFRFMQELARATDAWEYVSLQSKGAEKISTRLLQTSGRPRPGIWPFLLPRPLAGETCSL